MNLTFHLISKDFRYLQLYLSVWWGLVILQGIFIGSYPQDFLGEWKWEVPPVLFIGTVCSSGFLLVDTDLVSTRAKGLHSRKHRLLVKPTRIRQSVVGEQAIVSASCRGFSPPSWYRASYCLFVE